MKNFIKLKKQGVSAGMMLMLISPSYLMAGDAGAQVATHAIDAFTNILSKFGQSSDGNSSNGGPSRNFNFGVADPSNSLTNMIPNMPSSGIPGSGAPGAGAGAGTTIVQNFSINVGEQPPKGFSLATDPDGNPVQPKTTVDQNGSPITLIDAKDANGNPVVLEQSTGPDGKTIVTSISKDSNGQDIRTLIPSDQLQPVETLADLTMVNIDDILTNPRKGENFKIYNLLLSAAMRDKETSKKLKAVSDAESERAVLKYFALTKKDEQIQKKQEMQQKMQEFQSKRAQAMQQEAQERARIAESEAQEMKRLSEENKALYTKVFGMTPVDQRGQLVDNMASIANQYSVNSDSIPTSPTSSAPGMSNQSFGGMSNQSFGGMPNRSFGGTSNQPFGGMPNQSFGGNQSSGGTSNQSFGSKFNAPQLPTSNLPQLPTFNAPQLLKSNLPQLPTSTVQRPSFSGGQNPTLSQSQNQNSAPTMNTQRSSPFSLPQLPNPAQIQTSNTSSIPQFSPLNGAKVSPFSLPQLPTNLIKLG
ncbi:MAG: hypothetical protein HEEMFOPI_00404 [Holosporales bacterium]